MVEAEEMQDGGVPVVDVHLVVNGFVAVVVRHAVVHAAFDAAAADIRRSVGCLNLRHSSGRIASAVAGIFEPTCSFFRPALEAAPRGCECGGDVVPRFNTSAVGCRGGSWRP